MTAATYVLLGGLGIPFVSPALGNNRLAPPRGAGEGQAPLAQPCAIGAPFAPPLHVEGVGRLELLHFCQLIERTVRHTVGDANRHCLRRKIDSFQFLRDP